MKIGTNIRKIRQLRDLTQVYVAQQMGISTSSYRNIETDKLDFKLSAMIRLASILEVDPVQFFHFDPNATLGITSHLDSGYVTTVTGGTADALSAKERALYEQHTRLLKNQVELLSGLLTQRAGQVQAPAR